ncbi:hypothetical protein D5F01_LYC02203 [Larimichthys crocea]|uniref:Uncharacterized protein n=1 Tax=Larimichthys crocea TaxID=215358 RepID=A0A6G0J7N4_LARCR|nr:hypothetical protein D5F01_LYC02203 [Larimichthys crocea]
MGEWANIIIMPTFSSLVACKELTSNFRVGYVAVAHDVMLRRMKKAAVIYSRNKMREMQKEISTDEDEDPPQPPGLLSPKEENMREYLREVWRLKEGGTDNEDAKKLWLSHITSQPVDKSEPARQSYERLVLEDIDNEDAHIAKQEQNQTLTQVWHSLKQVIAPTRYVRALRMVTAQKSGEMTFVTMPVGGNTVPQMDEVVTVFRDQKEQRARKSAENPNQHRIWTAEGPGWRQDRTAEGSNRTNAAVKAKSNQIFV